MILSGTNTYTGGTFVNAGTLVATNPSAIENGTSLTVGAGASLFFAPVEATAAPAESAVAPVPEPSTVAIFAAALGCGAVCWKARRKRRGVRREGRGETSGYAVPPPPSPSLLLLPFLAAAAIATTAFAQGTPGTHETLTNYVSPIIGPTGDTVTVYFGNRVALVVDPQSSLPSPNQTTMNQIVSTLDNLYTAYDTVTGQTPLGGYELDGKILVEFTTNMPSGVAGTAAGNSGHYGIAVGNGFLTNSGELYDRVNQGINTYDQVLFYESQRDYWGGVFNSRIDYATSTNPNSWGWWTVGFNNAMSIFMSQPGVILGVSDMYYYGENGQQFSAGMLANLTTYENNPRSTTGTTLGTWTACRGTPIPASTT